MFNFRSVMSPIARRLIIYIILFSSFITLLITAIQLYRDYHTDLDLIHSELQEIERVHLQSLTSALWASNRKLLQTSLEGIAKIRDMQYVEIHDTERVWASAGEKIENLASNKNIIQRHYPMNYRHRNRDVNIGDLTIMVSLDGVYQRLIEKVWIILIANGLKTFLVAIFIYFLFYHLITKHLSKISEFAKSHDPLVNNQLLTLDRNTLYRDEFDTVVESINDMHLRLHEQMTEIDQQKQYLLQTLNSIGDAVIVTDASGNITRLNPVAEQLTGWSLEDAKGQSVKSIFPIINASTREAIENPIEKVIASGETIYLSNHTTLLAKGGEEYQIADSAAPIRDGDNNILGMVLVFNDVTEQYQLRKSKTENEERMADVQRMAHIGSWELDLVKNELKCSDEIYRIFEVDADDISTSYKVFLNMIHPDDRQKVNEAYTESIKNKSPYTIDHRLRMKNGSIKHVIERCKTIYDDEGNPLCSTGTVQDITEQVVMKENLQRSQKMDALGKLTGGIAHDYNNMLGVIIGYANMLEEKLSTQPGLIKYARNIHHAGERGARLTQKLLSFSRQKISNAESVNLNTLLRDEQDMLQKTLTAQIKLIYDLAEDLSPSWLDSSDLEDAIVNLCINASHAMEGKGQLTIRTQNVHINETDARLSQLNTGDYILLSITDSGCGMDEATKEKIYDPFYSTKGDKGTGLGLSQVYGFVKRSNGTIKVYSEPGHGTQFVLYFPRYENNGPSDPLQKENNLVDVKGHETVLIVDDEPALLELNREILNQYGYRTLCAENGLQALELLKTEAIDLLLSDIIMPEMDGYELAAIVGELYPDIKIQLASGFNDERHMNMVDESLQQNLLYKPYSSDTLLKRMRELLG